MYLRSASEAGSGRLQVITRTDPELPHACAREPPELVTCESTCAAAFNPKVWTCATAPRKTAFSELFAFAGLPVPAPPFAQRDPMISDANPRAKFLRELWKSGVRAFSSRARMLKRSGAADPASAKHHERVYSTSANDPFFGIQIVPDAMRRAI
ncbi:hypothetical protein GCM10019060_40300 [Novosphingobium pokkalii]|nr:hypothetical protein GCM10019060_40300 [Novosphingobium pokkalii]